MTGKSRHIFFEVLEPRILLSGDGLLSAAAPDPLQDNTPQVVQYAELLDTDEQIEQQVISDTSNHFNCQPILTLSVDDDKVNVESGDADLSIGNIGPAQTSDDLAVLSDDSEENVDSKITATEIVDIKEPTTNSSAVQTDDGSMPIYITDTDLSIEYATSIEIRGPPAGTTEYSTSSIISTYATSDGFTETSNDEGLHQLIIPHLPGLQLTNPDISSWNGQIIYLDFDGEQDVTYNGPVIIGPFDVPAFAAPGNLAGQEESIIADVVEALNQVFADSGVIFTIDQPTADQIYSTVYIGGGDSAFAEYGSFLGLAEQVDVGNKNRCDEAFVFSDGLSLRQIVSVIGHEFGHLLGYTHNEPDLSDSILSSVAAAPVVTDIPDQTIAEGSTFANINLDDYVSDVDNLDTDLNWTYSGNSELTVSITDRVATIGIPNEDWNGSETITFTATDPGAEFDSDAAIFTVMAGNNFSQDSTCVAVWNFESESLVTDSKGNNNLTNSGVNEDTIKHRQGACSAEFVRSVADSMVITDAALDSGFPIKSGESNKSFSFVFWVYLNTLDINQTCFGKGQSSPQYSTIVLVNSSNKMSLFMSQDGTTHNWYSHGSTLQVERWYHVGVTYDNSDYGYRIRIWDDTAQEILGTDLTGTSVDIHIGTAIFKCSQNSTLFGLDGNLDELVVFNDVLSVDEIDQIRQGVYGAATPPIDDDMPDFTVTESDGGTQVSESGTTDTFRVVLDTEPDSNVVINVTVSDAGEATVDLSSLTFTQANWNIPQTVTVTGEDDDLIDGDQTTVITLSIDALLSDDQYDGVLDQTISVTTMDDEAPGFTVTESDGGTQVSESGTTDTFRVVLDIEPDSNVVINVTVSDAGEVTVDLSSLTFTQANWNIPQTVTVTGEDDDLIDGNQTTWILLSIDDAASDDAFDAVADHIVNVTTTDDDTMTDEGLMAYWPLDEGSGTTTQDATGHGYIGTLSGEVSFTTGAHNNGVEFDGTDGIITFGNIDYQFSDSLTVAFCTRFSGTERRYRSITQKGQYCNPFMIWQYGSLLRVAVRTANDVYYLLSSSTLQVDTWYHVAVTYEDGSLSIYIDGQLDSELAAYGSLAERSESTTMGNSTVGGNYPFNGGLDEVYIYNRALTAGEIESLMGGPVTETPGFTVTESDGDTQVSESGTTDTFRVVLDTEPDSNVVINVTVSDAGEATVDLSSLTFTQANWNIPQTVTVTGEDDNLIDGDQTTVITLSIDALLSDDQYDGVLDQTINVTTADTTVPVNNVTVTLENTTTSLPENTDTANRINVAEIEVNGEALVTNDLSLGGDDAALFEIDPASVVGSGSSILYLKAGAVLDFETNPVLDVTVNVDDSDPETSPDDTADLSITITYLNEPPTVALINTTTTLSENTDTTNPTKVADIVVTDDGLGTNVLSLSGADASLFHIEGMELFLNAGVTLEHEVDLELYLNDPTCAAYWRFEEGALGSDSVGTNNLSVYGPQANTNDFIEGQASAEFSGVSDRLICLDSSLDAGFPMKSDGINKDITTIQWIKFSELGPHINEFWGKYKNGNVVYRLSAYADGMIRISSGYEGGFVNQEGAWFPTPVETDRWYFIASTYQYSDRSYRVQIYDYTAGDFLDDDLTGNFVHDVDVGDVGDGFFILGYASELFSFKGLMDACIVFNRALSVEELEDIRLGMHGGGNAALEVTVEVDDPTVVGTPDDTASLSITITANELNTAPALAAIEDRAVDEGNLLTFTAVATDSDIPANVLTFSLIGAPSGAVIDPVTGVFTWTPSEDQGPGAYPVTVIVTDDDGDSGSDTFAVNAAAISHWTMDDDTGSTTVVDSSGNGIDGTAQQNTSVLHTDDPIDDAGRYVDFHVLRHTTGSLLAASGVHPKIAQEIMRHNDINLTMSLCTHAERTGSRRGQQPARLFQAEQRGPEEDRDRRCECYRFCLGVLLGAFVRRTTPDYAFR